MSEDPALSWRHANPIQFSGLRVARNLIHLMAANIADVELSADDVVAISEQIDDLLLALKALSESNTEYGLDAEIEELLGGEEQ